MDLSCVDTSRICAKLCRVPSPGGFAEGDPITLLPCTGHAKVAGETSISDVSNRDQLQGLAELHVPVEVILTEAKSQACEARRIRQWARVKCSSHR
jgi:hypothetical protein